MAAEDVTVGSRTLRGYNGWFRDLTDDGNVEPHPGSPKGRGRRTRSAPRPLRRGIDLRAEALGAETTAARRRRFFADLDAWLAEQGHPLLVAFVSTRPELDSALKYYGQHMYSNDYAQGDFVETSERRPCPLRARPRTSPRSLVSRHGVANFGAWL